MTEFNKKSLILIGGGGHCRAILPVIREDERYSIAGIADKKADGKLQVDSIPVCYKDEDLKPLYNDGLKNAFLAIGCTGKDIYVRVKIYEKLLSIGFTMPSFISSKSIVQPGVNIGEGTIVMPSSVINPGAAIGCNCIINTASVVEHDCSIGENSIVSPGAVICGGVKVRNKVFIGASATILPEITVNESAVIGAGAIVTKSIPENVVAVGSPAEYK
jgi:UDP-perosamine 4-acetyltransferase